MLRAIEIRLYPTVKQTVIINKSLGSNRFVYNKCLDYKINAYKNNNESMGLQDLALFFAELRDNQGYDFLKEQNTKIIRSTLMNLMSAYTNFFRRVKKGNQASGFPKFKSRKNEQKITFPRQAISKNSVKDDRFNLTTQLKNVKFKCSKKDKNYLNENKEGIKSVTLTQTKSGKYFASVLIDGDLIKKVSSPKNEFVGIDLGIKTFAVLSNKEEVENPKWIRTNQVQLSKLHKQLSKKQKGSNNKEKARKKLAIKHEKIKNQKNNFLHNLTTKIINENQVIVLEDLSVKNMMKNHKLARAIQELSLHEFRRQLEYKAKWYNRDLIIIDRWFPSSKTCSGCGWYNKNLTLDDREFVCEECGLVIDRDLNASINIVNEGKRMFFENKIGISSPDYTPVDSAMMDLRTSEEVNTINTRKRQKQEENKSFCKES